MSTATNVHESLTVRKSVKMEEYVVEGYQFIRR